MGQEYLGFYLVDVLAAGAAAPGRFHLYVAFFKLKIHLLCFGHHGHGSRTCMYASALFGVGHSLYAMYPALEFERTIDVLADDLHLHLFITPNRTLAFAEYGRFPATLFTVFDVHTKQVARKQAGLIAARPGPDLEDRILLVLRVFGYQELTDMRFHLHLTLFQARSLRLGQIPELGIIAI